MPRTKGSVVFSVIEKELLLKLVKRFGHKVLIKARSTYDIEVKENGWAELTRKFNNRKEVHPRTPSQLKCLWKNLKVRAKADVAAACRPILNTDDVTDDIADAGEFTDQLCSIVQFDAVVQQDRVPVGDGIVVKAEPCSYEEPSDDTSVARSCVTPMPTPSANPSPSDRFSECQKINQARGYCSGGVMRYPTNEAQTKKPHVVSITSPDPFKMQKGKQSYVHKTDGARKTSLDEACLKSPYPFELHKIDHAHAQATSSISNTSPETLRRNKPYVVSMSSLLGSSSTSEVHKVNNEPRMHAAGDAITDSAPQLSKEISALIKEEILQKMDMRKERHSYKMNSMRLRRQQLTNEHNKIMDILYLQGKRLASETNSNSVHVFEN